MDETSGKETLNELIIIVNVSYQENELHFQHFVWTSICIASFMFQVILIQEKALQRIRNITLEHKIAINIFIKIQQTKHNENLLMCTLHDDDLIKNDS